MPKAGYNCTETIARDIQTGELENQWRLRCLWDSHNDRKIPGHLLPGRLIPWETIDVMKSYGFDFKTRLAHFCETPRGLICNVHDLVNWVHHNVPHSVVKSAKNREVTLVTLEKLNEWCGFRKPTRKPYTFERANPHLPKRIKYIEFDMFGAIEFKVDCIDDYDRCYTLLSRQLGFPLDALTFSQEGESFYKVTLKHPFLAQVLNDIVHFDYPSHENLRQLACGIIQSYSESRNHMDVKKYKADYQLVVLRDMREFARVQEKSDSPNPSALSIPLYWVDPQDHPEFFLEDVFRKLTVDPVKQLEDLISKLAIEENWYKPQYTVRCMFPPGSMFLKTSVEPTASKPGGGVEYIYVKNWHLTPKVQVLSVTKI